MDAEREPVTEAGSGSPGVSKPDPPAPAEQPDDGEPFEQLKAEIRDFRAYDEDALEQYRALSFYFARRRGGSNCHGAMMRIESTSDGTSYGVCTACGQPADGHAPMPQAMAAKITCENFGHDAPRGLCRRCGLGVELGDDTKRERERVEQRQAWLASRR
jgi:hypothetical protein